MASHPSFEKFQDEISRLVGLFEKNLSHYKKPGYDEASVRQEFLNPLFAALGWDVENKAGHIPQKREVEVESRTHIGGRQKRADYLFRTEGIERFVCEAKKPAVSLEAKEAFQAKRYAYNMRLPLAVLTDFEEMKVYVVSGRPYLGEPHTGEWKTWHFKQYALIAEEMWSLLSREKVAAGGIDQALDALPKKKATGKGKAKQQWLTKPDRSRTLDHDFLGFLDDARKGLASDIYKNNDHAALNEGNALNEAVQRILDRILFLRICEDRDIDTGTPLQSIVETWRRNYGHDEGRKFRQDSSRVREDSSLDLDDDGRSSGGGGRIPAPKESLWHAIVRHFRALDRRPASHVPYFNGNIFKLHGSERLIVGDEWLADFIGELSSEETPYLFNMIPVEILGSVYERFLGKIVRPHGKGITVEEKPEVRKAGGVYYTPRYIVDYIVEQTVGRQLDAIAGIPASEHLRPESTAPGRSTQAKGSARFQRAASGILPDARDVVGATGSAKPPASREPGWLRQDAEAGTLEACAPVSRTDTRAVTPAAFEKASLALRILDPACGSGSFLIRAFERVCEHWQQWLTENKEQRKRAWCWVDAETGDVHLTVDLKRRILTQNIYGVDLDAAAVEVTQLSLYLKMLEHENRTTMQRERELFAEAVAVLPPLEGNIKCGNSLIASDFSMMHEDLLRVNAFDWPTGFREIMKAGGFDAVIGNPPWGSELDEHQLQYLREHHQEIIVRMIDSFMYFVNASLRIIRSAGHFGMILPDVMLYQSDTEKLRRLLVDHQTLLCVANLGNVFEQVTRPSCVVAFVKSPPKTNFVLVTNLTEEDGEAKAKCLFDGSKFQRVSQAKFSETPRCLFTTGDLAQFELWQRLLTVPHDLLADMVDEDGLQRGVSPDLKDAFLVDAATAKDWKLEAEKLRLSLTGGKQVKRYNIERPDLRVIYTSRDDDFSRLPNICRYIEQFRKRITCKEVIQKKHSIYALHRARDERIFTKPQKLLGVITEDEIILALDTEQTYPTDGIYLFAAKDNVDIRYLMGILNSRMFVILYRLLSMEEGRAMAQVKPTLLAKLPIRRIDFTSKADRARHDQLVEQVDKMLALVPKLRGAKHEKERGVLQNAVDSTDRKIDDLVYELYALTPEEIALVEGTEK